MRPGGLVARVKERGAPVHHLGSDSSPCFDAPRHDAFGIGTNIAGRIGLPPEWQQAVLRSEGRRCAEHEGGSQGLNDGLRVNRSLLG